MFFADNQRPQKTTSEGKGQNAPVPLQAYQQAEKSAVKVCSTPHNAPPPHPHDTNGLYHEAELMA